MYDLVIRNATLVTGTAVSQADIAVSDEQIAAVGPELDAGREELDASRLHVFPGLIDAHVHFNEPGRADWEGFATGTRALAAGGVTTFFDMPLNSHPPTVNAAGFDQKRATAERSSMVDFGLWGGIVPGNVEDLDELAERGVLGFKAFMSNSGVDDFAAVDDLTLLEGMARAARLGRLVALHAENDQLTSRLAQRAIADGRTGVRDYLDSRPAVAELEAIERAIVFAAETGCRLHIVHVSTGRGVSLVAAARARGVDVSCETCPHYLALTDEDMEELGAIAKCAPPLRPVAEAEALWQQLAASTLPMVASDHSPAPASMKRDADFFKVWGGISSCQTTLLVLLTEGYYRRQLPLATIAASTAEYVARRWELAPAKGALAVGADADFALVDVQASYQLKADDLHYRHRHSPYVGRTLRGRVVRTILRGATVFRDGEHVGQPRGRLQKPAPAHT